MADTDTKPKYVIHAGTDTVHKLQTSRMGTTMQTVVNHTRTECGTLTDHMGKIEEHQLERVPDSNFCSHCFSNA